MAAQLLGAGYIELGIKYDDAVKKIGSDIGGLESAAATTSRTVAANLSKGFEGASKSAQQEMRKVEDAIKNVTKLEKELDDLRKGGAGAATIQVQSERIKQAKKAEADAVKATATAYESAAVNAGAFTNALAGLASGAGLSSKAADKLASSITGISGKTALVTAGIAGIGLAAVAVGKQLYDVGAQWDDISDNITIRTGKMGDDLKSLTDIVGQIGKTTAADLGVIGDVVGRLSQAFSNLPADVIKQLGSNLAFLDAHGQAVDILELSRAFSAFNIAPTDAVKALDDLNRASQATGIPLNSLISTIQQGAPQFREFNLNIGQATSVLADFSRAGIDPIAAVQGLRLAFKNVGDDVRGAAPALAEAVTQIKAFSDANTSASHAAAQALAASTFGAKTFQPFLLAIETGAIDAQSFKKAMDNLGPSLKDLAENTDDGAQGFTKLKNTIETDLGPVADKIFGAINKAIVFAGRNLQNTTGDLKDFASVPVVPGSALDVLMGGGGGGRSSAPPGLPLPFVGPNQPGGGTGPGLQTGTFYSDWYKTPEELKRQQQEELSNAPKLPINTALPPGFANLPQNVDLLGAESSFIDARHELEEKRARLDELEKSGIATANDIQDARNNVYESERKLDTDTLKLYDTRQGMFDKERKRAEDENKRIEEEQKKYESRFSGGSLLDFLIWLAFKPVHDAAAQQSAALNLGQSTKGGGPIDILPGSQGTTLGDIGAATSVLPSITGAQTGATQVPSELSSGDGGLNLSTIPVAAQKYANDCIDASARIILSHSGVNMTEDELKNVITPGGSIDSLAAGLNQLNPQGNFVAMQGSGGSQQAMFSAIQASINSGTGSILNVAPGSSLAGHTFAPGHFIAATGYNPDGTINVSDTAGGTQYSVSQADAFQATRGRGIVAGTGVGPPPTGGVTAPATPTGPSAAPSGLNWDALAARESSGNWSINTGNGYYGGLQFDAATWAQYGGTQYAPNAALATKDQQIAIAQQAYNQRGGGSSLWPQNYQQLQIPMAGGGSIPGFGGGDKVPILAEGGEFVVNKNAARQWLSFLKGINAKGYSTGGPIKLDPNWAVPGDPGYIDPSTVSQNPLYSRGSPHGLFDLHPGAESGWKPGEMQPSSPLWKPGGYGKNPLSFQEGGPIDPNLILQQLAQQGQTPGAQHTPGQGQQPIGPDMMSATPGKDQSTPLNVGRTQGYIPAGAGASGQAGSSLFSGAVGLGADVINKLIDEGVSAASSAAGVAGSAFSFGAGGGAAAGATSMALGIGADIAKKGVSYGAQVIGILGDSLAEILLPFGVPRFFNTDPRGFMPQIAGLPAAVTTGEKALLGDKGKPEQQPGAPVQPGQLPGRQPVGAPVTKADPGGVTPMPVDIGQLLGGDQAKKFGPGIPGADAKPGPRQQPGALSGPGSPKPPKQPKPGPPGQPSTAQKPPPVPKPQQPKPTPFDAGPLSMLGIFDSGGWLMPNQLALNAGKTPEPILSDQQWRSVKAIAGQQPGRYDPSSAGNSYDYRTMIENVTVKDVEELSRSVNDRQRIQMMRYSGRPLLGSNS